MDKRTWAEIDLNAIEHNIREIRRITDKNSKIMAVVKADAYGHGVLNVADTLLKNGADMLGVADMDEAVELRMNGFSADILILGYCEQSRIGDGVQFGITMTVCSFEFAQLISDAAVKAGKTAKIHIKIDTGMSRIGFYYQEHGGAIEEIKKIFGLPNLFIEGIFTHFAASDEADKGYTNRQFELFCEICDRLKNEGCPIPVRHCSNSGAIIDCPQMHLDMVRAGIILYGYYPSDEVNQERLSLIPAMTLKSTVVQVKEIEKGAGISYGKTVVAEHPMRIATIPVGYADGYPRALSSRGLVEIDGKIVQITGRVCMDQCMIDISSLPQVKHGDQVILFGRGQITADTIAKIRGTIHYEVLCDVKRRVPRVYIRDGKMIDEINYICNVNQSN